MILSCQISVIAGEGQERMKKQTQNWKCFIGTGPCKSNFGFFPQRIVADKQEKRNQERLKRREEREREEREKLRR